MLLYQPTVPPLGVLEYIAVDCPGSEKLKQLATILFVK